MNTLYGIKTCDTVRKARKWLDNNGVDYSFHDLRIDGIDKTMVNRWCNAAGWETILNRRSTSWKTLDEKQRQNLDQDKAIGLILENPTLVKRPVLETGDQVIVGFRENEYQNLT